MGIFTSKWPFYIGGGVLAFAFLLGLYTLNDVLGMGDSLTQIRDYCVDTLEHEEFVDSISFDYTLGLILGIMLGAFTAAVFSSNFRLQFFASYSGGITIKAFKTVVFGFSGGFLVMLGVQIAGESIYGQIISAMQLSIGAWIFLGTLMLSGGIVAILLEHGGKSSTEGE